ncbi:MAG: hypothetical protein MJK10_00090 [Pseudomonadales bacterium]|nr:hypothetical protein [Pseudomonadales bacterium]NRA14278.1 hypothetical protein [Oceanospirillaceae bacterium]
MPNSQLQNYKAIISRYIQAKDQNRPHLLSKVFSTNAQLQMQVNSENIAFPSQTHGLQDITQVLVKSFGQSYENIYTFCIEESVTVQNGLVKCQWLVGMSERETGSLRIGVGDYHWQFSKRADGLVDSLMIKIEQMLVLNAEHQDALLYPLENLPYPWCSRQKLLEQLPNLAALQLIKSTL